MNVPTAPPARSRVPRSAADFTTEAGALLLVPPSRCFRALVEASR